MISCGNWKEASLIRHQSWKLEGNGEDEKKMQKHRCRKELFRRDLFFLGKTSSETAGFWGEPHLRRRQFLEHYFLEKYCLMAQKNCLDKRTVLEKFCVRKHDKLSLSNNYIRLILRVPEPIRSPTSVYRTCGDAAAASSLSRRRRRQHSPLQGDGWGEGDLLRI